MPSTQLKLDPKWITGIGGAEKIERGYALPTLRTDDGCLVIPVRFTRREKRMLRRKKMIAPSIWAERFRPSPRTSRFKGLWRNANVPCLAGIMDASFFKSVEEIIVVAAPQSGKTEAVYTCLGYAADRQPGNAVITFPNETDAADNAKDRLKPMFEDSPRLREYLTGYSDDLGAKKISLQHMIIYMAWANSPSRLANRPAMYGYADEEEKFPVTASRKEGSPVDLLKKRLRTYRGMRKLWRTSSPSVESGSIWVALTEEAQLVFDYFVRCPVCGGFQKMEFGDEKTKHGIKWTPDERDPLVIEATRDVWYQCLHCDAKWDTAMRDDAVRAGEWRDRAHGRSLFVALESVAPIRIGFHLPAWPSPFVELWECAAAFLKANKTWKERRDPQPMKDFRNGFAAEPWVIQYAARREDPIKDLKDARPSGKVPGGGVVAALTAGVDTQDDGFWYEIRAWGYGEEMESWQVRAGFVTSSAALKQLLWEDEYLDVDGKRYVVALAVQDAMGHRTREVYDFCRANRGRILPSKGEQKLAQPFSYSNQEFYPGTKTPIPGGLNLIRVNTTYYKNSLASILEVAGGDPGAWHMNAEMTDEWAEQMTAECLDEKGLYWINPKQRANHAWDCSVLNLCAAEVIGVRYFAKPKPAPTPKPSPEQSDIRETYKDFRPGWLNR